jgi:hypothetical protein
MIIDMKITIENYEAYLLDLIEGRLGEARVKELREFVLGHPSLGSWDELTGEMPGLVPDEPVFGGKELLKKPEIAAFGNINESNYEYFFVSEIEGLLNDRESKHLKVFLKTNSDVQKVFDLYQHTRLMPEVSIVFPSKESLQKKTVEMHINKRIVWSSIAAALLLMFSLSWWFLGHDQAQQPEVVVSIQKSQEPGIVIPAERITEPSAIAAAEEFDLVEETRHQPLHEAHKEPEVLLRKELLPVMAAILSDAISLRTGGSPIYVRQTSSNQMMNLTSDDLAMASETNRKPLLSRIAENAAEKLASNLLPSSLMERKSGETETDQGKGTLLWDLASAGVKTYNLLTDNEVLLTKAHDQHGNMTSIGLQSEKINIARRLGPSAD